MWGLGVDLANRDYISQSSKTYMANTHFSGPVVSPGGFTGNLTGNVTGNLTGLALQGGANVAARSGATVIPVTNLYSGYTTNATADITATLANGVAGQMKIIKLVTKDTNNMVLTPANLADGTTIKFDATGEVAVLVFDGTNWQVVYTNATVA